MVDDAGRLDGREDLVVVGEVEHEGLFGPEGLLRLADLEDVLLVQGVGAGDDDGLDGRVVDQFVDVVGGIEAVGADLGGGLLAPRPDQRHVGPRAVGHQPRQVLAVGAIADQADPEPLCHCAHVCCLHGDLSNGSEPE